jgi:hypothetical protein
MISEEHVSFMHAEESRRVRPSNNDNDVFSQILITYSAFTSNEEFAKTSILGLQSTALCR